jgi:hypothetical protein
MRRQGGAALLAIRKLLGLLCVVRTAAAGSGVALSTFWNGHEFNPLSSHHPNLRVWPMCIQQHGILPNQRKPQILNYSALAVNRGEKTM